MDYVAKCLHCRKSLTYEDMRFSKYDDVVCSDECASIVSYEVESRLAEESEYGSDW